MGDCADIVCTIRGKSKNPDSVWNIANQEIADTVCGISAGSRVKQKKPAAKKPMKDSYNDCSGPFNKCF
jgi:hypothetical protein